jgi:hypothetical protein
MCLVIRTVCESLERKDIEPILRRGLHNIDAIVEPGEFYRE